MWKIKNKKINFINNYMNNVTKECDEKNEENSSIYEDNKNSFLQLEDVNNLFIYLFISNINIIIFFNKYISLNYKASQYEVFLI